MSFFSSAVQWFQQSGVEDQLKQIAIKELTDTCSQFVDKLKEHAPDMVESVEDQLTTILATGVAGALTRK